MRPSFLFAYGDVKNRRRSLAVSCFFSFADFFFHFDHLAERNGVRDDRRPAEERARVGADQEIVDDPWHEACRDEQLEGDRILDIHEQHVDGAHNKWQPAECALRVEADREVERCGDEQRLDVPRQLVLVADDVPDDAEHIADRAGDAAEHRHTDGLHQKLDRLPGQNLRLLLHRAGPDHDHSGGEVNDVGDDNNCHKSSPQKRYVEAENIRLAECFQLWYDEHIKRVLPADG